MKSQDLRKNQKYIYNTGSPWFNKYTITYTGTARDVKNLMHWFFILDADGSTIFLNENQVNGLTASENSL